MDLLLPCLVLSSLVAAPQFEVQPVDGATMKGHIQSLDAQQLTLLVTSSTGSAVAKVSLPISQVAGIVQCEKLHPPRPDSDAIAVDLSDGSKVQVSGYTVKAGVAGLLFVNGDTLTVPTENIISVRLQHGSPAALGEWERILAKRAVGDLLVTSKQGSLDFHQGEIHDISDTHVDFEVEGDKLHVKREKVFGLQYYHNKLAETSVAASNNSSPVAAIDNGLRIVDMDASEWLASEARVEPDSEVLSFSVAGSSPRQRTLGSIYSMDLSQGKIVYLSDLKPDKAAFTPFFPLNKELESRAEMFRVRSDQNLLARPLQIQGQEFRKGLSMHSRSEIAWTLPPGFTRLVATVGIDDEVRPQGSVRLVIHGDDKILFDELVTGADAAKNIRLSIEGVRRLAILADFGDANDISGHLDLGNARLFK